MRFIKTPYLILLRRGENVITEEEEIIVPESNWGRRIIAYLIDLVLVFIIALTVFFFVFRDPWLSFIYNPLNYIPFILFWLWMGFLTLLYSGGFEGGIGATVGKGFMGLEVYSLDTEHMTMGKGFTRSLSKFIFFVPGIDYYAGKGKGDPRQRQLDLSANTIVADFIQIEQPVPQIRSGRIPFNEIPQKEVEDEWADLPIPKELLSGNCSRCGTPYNIVPSKDKKTWSGLWNSRCIWCNKMVSCPGSTLIG